MKRRLSIILICVLVITFLTSVGVICQEYSTQEGYTVEVNGEATDYSSVIFNNVHYVPMRRVFEQMGAAVFYRGRDSQILALSCNGDEIRHIVGQNVITVNGEARTFYNPSILQNDVTYMPIDMVSMIFWVDGISYDNQRLNIQKQTSLNKHHSIIKDVLDVSKQSNFNPEKFQRYINYHTKMPSYSIQDVVFRVNHDLDRPFYENVKIIEQPYEQMVLVNKYNQLPAGFSQKNLVNMDRRYTINDGKEYLLADITYHKYVRMFDAAQKDGISIKVLSAYRTENYQRGLYNSKVQRSGKFYADNYSARPGFSEHQTGYAVDINSTLTSFENTAAFKWLTKHAHEYGFIMRYPRGKEWITGYAYEPWHYRYVGEDAAKIIHDEGITYEEYYAKYISASEFRY